MSGRIAKLSSFEEKFVRKDLPSFEIGDTVKMKVKVQEADKTRLHPWEGTVIARRGTGIKETFTVRKISFGEGVERVFPIHSPVIASLQVVAKAKVKRAKLFHLRENRSKKNRLKTEAVAPAAL